MKSQITKTEVSDFSVPRWRFASDGILDRFQFFYFSSLTPETLRFGISIPPILQE